MPLAAQLEIPGIIRISHGLCTNLEDALASLKVGVGGLVDVRIQP